MAEITFLLDAVGRSWLPVVADALRGADIVCRAPGDRGHGILECLRNGRRWLQGRQPVAVVAGTLSADLRTTSPGGEPVLPVAHHSTAVARLLRLLVTETDAPVYWVTAPPLDEERHRQRREAWIDGDRRQVDWDAANRGAQAACADLDCPVIDLAAAAGAWGVAELCGEDGLMPSSLGARVYGAAVAARLGRDLDLLTRLPELA